MGNLYIPGDRFPIKLARDMMLIEDIDTSKVSDGFHSFDELYEHRCVLFMVLMSARPELSWRSLKHHDGTGFDGWFIAGMHLPTGDITYHLPMKYWERLGHIEERAIAPQWDGHDAHGVLNRLLGFVG